MKCHLFDEESELNFLQEPEKTLCGLLSSQFNTSSEWGPATENIKCNRCDIIKYNRDREYICDHGAY